VIDIYQLELLEDRDNVYASYDISDVLKIKTYYESLDIAQSNRIHYLKFKINKELPVSKDEILKDMFREPAVD